MLNYPDFSSFVQNPKLIDYNGVNDNLNDTGFLYFEGSQNDTQE